MRRTFVVMVGAVTIGALLLSGAVAAGQKKKKIRESYQATAAPFPVGSYDDGEGCIHGVDGVHKVTHPFEAPYTGNFVVRIPQLTGDWDLFVLDDNGEVKAESSGSTGEPEETGIRLRKNQAISIVVCNWLGEPTITVEYEFG